MKQANTMTASIRCDPRTVAVILQVYKTKGYNPLTMSELLKTALDTLAEIIAPSAKASMSTEEAFKILSAANLNHRTSHNRAGDVVSNTNPEDIQQAILAAIGK